MRPHEVLCISPVNPQAVLVSARAAAQPGVVLHAGPSLAQQLAGPGLAPGITPGPALNKSPVLLITGPAEGSGPFPGVQWDFLEALQGASKS